jgi:hypothetical protein
MVISSFPFREFIFIDSEMLDESTGKAGFQNDVSSFMKLFIRELPSYVILLLSLFLNTSPVISNSIFQKLFDNYRFNARLSISWVSVQLSQMDTKSRNLLYAVSLLCCHVVEFLCVCNPIFHTLPRYILDSSLAQL